ncbi:cysteine-rich CWC family protein [Pelomonas sp. KK5]|uniref:cysteine-rich CWC family protein n=1 Tax=Pelomonas sp. KK5 TaxID=1855730 RepID=UPI00097BCCB7|nr:cysteine-rich CWC family protein [Pelomonas sp. KK5]
MSGAALDDTCPRCGGGFHCGVNDARCDCFGLNLGAELKQRLAGEYPGRCLCVSCLKALQEEDEAALRRRETTPTAASPSAIRP